MHKLILIYIKFHFFSYKLFYRKKIYKIPLISKTLYKLMFDINLKLTQVMYMT